MNSSNTLNKFFFVILLIGVFTYLGVHNFFYKKSILENPDNVVATIVDITNCFKNGRCVEYEYKYNGETYKDFTRCDWDFSNWCATKGDCKGFKFEITINKKEPEENIAKWDEILNKKQFLNYSSRIE